METTEMTTSPSDTEVWRRALELATSGCEYGAIRELFKAQGHDFDQTLEKIAPHMTREQFFWALLHSMDAKLPADAFEHIRKFKGTRKQRRAQEAVERRVVKKAHRRR